MRDEVAQMAAAGLPCKTDSITALCGAIRHRVEPLRRNRACVTGPWHNCVERSARMATASGERPAIVAENASKVFLDGAVLAFHQLNLAVRGREILCIVGPSGCGKTTLLRCIGGLTELSDGRLVVEGAPVARSEERRVGKGGRVRG